MTMGCLSTVICVYILFSSVISASGLTQLRAVLNYRGVKGSVAVSQSSANQITIKGTFTGLSIGTFQIHNLRVHLDVKDRCSALGDSAPDFSGSFSSGSVDKTITSSQDINSLLGKSFVLLEGGQPKACGTLEGDGDHVTVIARFKYSVGGDVVFRQLSSDPTSPVSISTDLFFVNDTSSSKNLKWAIYTKVIGVQQPIVDRCTNTGDVFNPTAATGTSCSKNSPGNCKWGDLSGKLGDLLIGYAKNSSMLSFVDTNLALSGSNGTVDKTLVLMSATNDVISCARLTSLSPRKAKVIFNNDNITGEIAFSQASPFDSTNMRVTLQGLNSQAHNYHIHLFPVPQRITKDDVVCSDDNVAGHFNPFHVTATKAAGEGTNDEYEIGDLAGKFGNLDTLGSYNLTTVDWNLPMFGVQSIIGRSVVIHKMGGARWVCADIVSEEVTTIRAMATFTHPVIGYIYLQQPQTDPELSDTQVFVKLNYGDNMAPTVNHNWHIHVDRIDFSQAETSWCSSVAGHYNPYGVNLEGNYQASCSPLNPLRCELGDLSGKHGQINVRTAGRGFWKGFYSDVDLPLSGPTSVATRSIVVHGADSGGARMACADLYVLPEKAARVESWKMSGGASPVSGTTNFKSIDSHLTTGVGEVSVDLSGLNSQASGFHIHEHPVPNTNAPCSPASVGGHFNPFQAVIPTDFVTYDKFEIGDLSGKYGDPLRNKASADFQKKDTNLPLSGVNSIMGRSVVVHKAADGSRWVCGDIVEDTSVTNSRRHTAKAEFKGDVTGSITMVQYEYADGGLSDTTVTIDLAYQNNASKMTDDHNWHVHELPVAMSMDCMSTGGHFNPYHMNTTVGYDECSVANPLRCEVGDSSNKMAQYSIGSGRKTYTDSYLPLIGRFGVNGRSFVVHVANGGAPRLACADILPVGAASLTLNFPSMDNFYTGNMKTTLAAALHSNPWDLAVEMVSNDTCYETQVYLVGEKATEMKTKLYEMAKSDDVSLGPYAPKKCSKYTGRSSVLQSSFLVLAICFLLSL